MQKNDGSAPARATHSVANALKHSRGLVLRRDQAECLRRALSDLLRSLQSNPSCQAGLVSACLCRRCAVKRAQDALARCAERRQAGARLDAATVHMCAVVAADATHDPREGRRAADAIQAMFEAASHDGIAMRKGAEGANHV